MRKQMISCLVLAILMAFDVQTAVSADDLVKFESAAFLVGQIQQRQARERGETSTAAAAVVEGYLARPEGSGPFPAVVFLHGCGGLSEKTRLRISKLFSGWGYVSLAVDSFATRGIRQACDRRPPVRQGDALGALIYLSKLPFVDSKRIVVVGASQGGGVALQLASIQPADLFAVPDGLKFRAAVAYYPLCNVANDQFAIPTVILIGELDDWSPARSCEWAMARRVGRGAPVKLVVYPGVYHSFDVPSLAGGKLFFGHWLQYDADAAARSISEMQDFLAAELKISR